jgi:predicted phage-related endonuclease
METQSTNPPQLPAHEMGNGQITIYPSREPWLERRRTGIGSSDAAVILGVSRFGSPLSLYHDKLGNLPPSPRESDFTRWGLILEGPIAERFAEEVGRAVLPPTALLGVGLTSDEVNAIPESLLQSRYVIQRDKDEPRLLASCDRAQVDGERVGGKIGILEVKNASIYVADEWDEEQGEPPLEYLVQVQHQLMVTGAPYASIAALVGGVRFVWADVPRDEEFIAKLRERELEFLWHLDKGIPPPVDGSDHTRAILKRLHPRDTGEIKPLPPAMLDWAGQLVTANEELKKWKAAKQEAENHIIEAIGDATIGTLPNGDSFSYKTQTRGEFISRETTFRVLRHSMSKRPKKLAGGPAPDFAIAEPS